MSATITVGARVLESDRKKAEALIRHYQSVGGRATPPPVIRIRGNGQTRPVTMAEICNARRLLKLGKAPGHDGICAEHLKHLGPVGMGTLRRMFTVYLTTGEIPWEWKYGVIIPIPKLGKETRSSSPPTGPSL